MVEVLEGRKLFENCIAWVEEQRTKEEVVRKKKRSSIEEDEPIYTNSWSAGIILRGEEATPVPEVLLKPLPKKPPKRREP